MPNTIILFTTDNSYRTHLVQVSIRFEAYYPVTQEYERN